MRDSKDKFIKGEGHPFYGNSMPEETKQKIANSLTGKKHTEVTKLKMSKQKKLELHPGWLGGKSFEPYTSYFNAGFKEYIRERDNRCCSVCNTPEENLIKKLHVHHIGYDKLNSFKQNCVALCNSCHIITNSNRNVWKIHFQALLKERYNYQYTKDQKIILDFTDKHLS